MPSQSYEDYNQASSQYDKYMGASPGYGSYGAYPPPGMAPGMPPYNMHAYGRYNPGVAGAPWNAMQGGAGYGPGGNVGGGSGSGPAVHQVSAQ